MKLFKFYAVVYLISLAFAVFIGILADFRCFLRMDFDFFIPYVLSISFILFFWSLHMIALRQDEDEAKTEERLKEFENKIKI